jgi:hypothetical protein
MYQMGLGVPKDAGEAVKWYRLGAAQGNAYCQINLGFLYEHGDGIEQSDSEASNLYRKAAAQGDARGQYFLARAYAEGRGVPQDYNEAANWYRKAAEQGHEVAREELDKLYEKGLLPPIANFADIDAYLMRTRGIKGVIPNGPLKCEQWPAYEPPQERSQAIEFFKFPYLLGIQYGHSTAIQDYFTWLRPKIGEDPDQTFNPQWRALLFPSESGWYPLIPEINVFCNARENRSELIAGAAARILHQHQPGYKNAGKPEDRRELLNRYSCEDVTGHINGWFLAGYRDAQRFIWDQLETAGTLGRVLPAWKTFAAGLEARQFQTPAGTDLYPALADFCKQQRNQAVPFVFAARAVASRLRGDDEGADSLLSPFYCKRLPSVWVKGKEARATSCLGVVVIVEAAPVLKKPIAYMTGVMNESDNIVEVNWSNWSLEWTDRTGSTQASAALDPDKVVRHLEKRANLAAAVAAFGANMSASSPRSAVIYDSRGVSTIRVYPGPEVASAASREAAKDAAEPKLALARTFSDVAFRRTTIAPRSRTGGMLLFFDTPKGSEAHLKLHIPGVGLFVIPVAARATE